MGLVVAHAFLNVKDEESAESFEGSIIGILDDKGRPIVEYKYDA